MRNEDFFENLRQTLTETAEVVGKKAEDLVEIQKLHSSILPRENEWVFRLLKIW